MFSTRGKGKGKRGEKTETETETIASDLVSSALVWADLESKITQKEGGTTVATRAHLYSTRNELLNTKSKYL